MEFANSRCAKLVLNTQMFYPAGTGTIAAAGALDTTQGTADPARLTCTFTNLDWKVILGDLYDRYDTFAFVPVTATYLSIGGVPFGQQGLGVTIRATGLDWIDQTYDVYKKSKTSSCVIASFAISAGMTNQPVFNTCMFRKPAGNACRDLTLQLFNSWTDTQVSAGQTVPAAFYYMINIYGVDKTK